MDIWVFGVIGLVILIGMIVAAWLRYIWRQLHEAVRTRFSSGDIVRMNATANFFGRRSWGLAQVRGNGVLVLTPKLLWFMQAIPRRETSVALNEIKEVSEPRSFLGKSIVSPLLCVTFDTPEGEDAIAWAVGDRKEWVEDIERLRSQEQ